MGEQWRANVAYGPAGTRVEYEGTVYELIQPHTSQIGWEPTLTPALWRVARNQDGGSSHHSENNNNNYQQQPQQQQQYQPQQQQQYQPQQQQQYQPQQQQQYQPQQQQQYQPQQQQQYQPQQQQQYQQQQQQQYQQQPQQNMASGGVPYQWVEFNGNFPQNVVSESNSLGKTFVVARADVKGGKHPGYADIRNKNCYTSYAGEEVESKRYEVLVCEPGRYSWTPCSNPANINGNPIQGGYERDNTPLYVCKCIRDGVPYFGKTSPRANCAYYGFDRKERDTDNFEVLTFH